MRKAVILCLIVLTFTVSVKASELEMNDPNSIMEQLYQGIPSSAEEILPNDLFDNQDDLNVSIRKIVLNALEKCTETIRHILKMILQVFLITVLCSLMICSEEKVLNRVSVIAGTLMVVLSCLADVGSMFRICRSTMDEIRTLSAMLLPVMTSVSAGTGAVKSAASIYSVTVLFSNLLILVCGKLLMPMTSFSLALAVTDSLLQSSKLKQFRQMIGWMIKTGLKWIMYLYTGFLSLSGILAGSADAITLKAAKMAISGMVPVVGGIISDATEAVLVGTAQLKQSIGVFGILAIICIFLVPFMKIGLWFMGFRLVNVLCSVVESRLSGCLEAISDSMGYILAMVGSCSLINLLACLSYFKTATI